MATVLALVGREIIDSRGLPTLEVEVTTKDGHFRASVPSGVTVSSYEVTDLRDKDSNRYLGYGVQEAVRNVNGMIAKRLEGYAVEDQNGIDQILHDLDNTSNFSYLGGNATLGVSMALARAGSYSKGIPLFHYISELAGKVILQLPIPVFNMINGGVLQTSDMPYHEFMIVPIGAKSFREALRAGCEIYHILRNLLFKNYGRAGITVGDDGGFCPPINSASECCDMIVEAIEQAGYNLDTIKIAIDVAASSILKATPGPLSSEHTSTAQPPNMMTSYLSQLMSGDHAKAILCIEDPFGENDWSQFSELTSSIKQENDQIVTNAADSSNPSSILVFGDNLIAGNIGRIHEAAEKRACNALLLKPNQCGTVTDSIQAALVAEKYGWTVMTARRVGETEDDFIADFSVGITAKYIKAGAPCRSERLAKYNQLLRIEELLETTTCQCCGSLSCQCERGHCGCQTKSGHREFNYGVRYKTHCSS